VEGGRQSRVKFSVADDEQTQAPQAQEEYLSLNDILAEFKEGVYQSIKQEDFQGHYDLGIAYKEMGLVQEAIAEFQLSSKGEKERLKSFEMLGICFMERGEYKFAIRQLERGLATPGFEEESYLGLRYNLAQSYENVGETDNAVKAYEEIYSTDVSFKDVAQKLQQLKAPAAPAPKPAPVQPARTQALPPRPAAQPAPQQTQPRPQPQPAPLPTRPAPVQPQVQPPVQPVAAPRPSIAQPQPQYQQPAAAPAPRPMMPPPPAAPVYAPQPPARAQEEAPMSEIDSSPKPKPIPSKLKKPEKQRISYV
jgi:tetratricopeptide (TPR) repeat protein